MSTFYRNFIFPGIIFLFLIFHTQAANNIINGDFEFEDPNGIRSENCSPRFWTGENFFAAVESFEIMPEHALPSEINWEFPLPARGKKYGLLSTGDIGHDSTTDFASMTQTITLLPGQAIVGYYFFGTFDWLSYPDQARITLVPDPNTMFPRPKPLMTIDVTDVGQYSANTDWQRFIYIYDQQTAGTFDLSFIIEDIGDDIYKSYFAVDAFSICDQYHQADLNFDCTVNMLDFALMAQYWTMDCNDPNIYCDSFYDLDHSEFIDAPDVAIMADQWLMGNDVNKELKIKINPSAKWMYQNFPGMVDNNITFEAQILEDQAANSDYYYIWDIAIPDDVNGMPVMLQGGTEKDSYWTIASNPANEPNEISMSGTQFEITLTVIGKEYGNFDTQSEKFSIVLLGDVNNDGIVNVKDAAIVNAYWKTGSAGSYTLKDCDLNSDGTVNETDLDIVCSVWNGILGIDNVDVPPPNH